MPKTIDSLYMHFPFCAHLCNYCDFFKQVTNSKDRDFKNYHSYLEESWQLHQNSLIEKHGYSWGPLKTLYLGGGTPSFWGTEGKLFLEKFFNKHNIMLAPDCEFTLEVNPGVWSADSLKAWMELGANRFSLGVQSLNAEMLKLLDRYHSIEEAFETLNFFNSHNLNFSMDFMLGLPSSKQQKRDVLKELEMALQFNPSHFSVYILTVKENYKNYEFLPDEEYIEEEYLKVAEYLSAQEFHHYEVSNFALSGKQSIHNLNYWKSRTVAALGPSATGFFSEEKLRYKWATQKAEFKLEHLSEAEVKMEQVYMALRSEVGLDLNQCSEMMKSLCFKWEKEGTAKIRDGKVALTSRGYLIIDSLMNDLFASKLL